MAMLPLLATLAQVKLPYHIDRVESNDSLYALSDIYNEELRNIVNSVLEKALSELHNLKQSAIPAMQQAVSGIALDLFNILLAHAEMDLSTAQLAARLYNMAQKSSNTDQKYLRNSLEAVNARMKTHRGSQYAELKNKMTG